MSKYYVTFKNEERLAFDGINIQIFNAEYPHQFSADELAFIQNYKVEHTIVTGEELEKLLIKAKEENGGYRIEPVEDITAEVEQVKETPTETPTEQGNSDENNQGINA